LQAALLLTIVLEQPSDQAGYDAQTPDDRLLIDNAIMAMADRIYLERPFRQVNGNPFSSETIGSYSYSKGTRMEVTRMSAASKAIGMESTGIMWWDICVRQLAARIDSGFAAGQVHVFEVNSEQWQVTRDPDTGELYLLGPADHNQEVGALGFFVNADSHDPAS
jgi:hypothetical protein